MTAHASLKSDASPADAPRATPHPAWLAALLCLLAAALVRPTLRAWAPEVAVSVWLAGDEIDDPWGRPYAERFVGPRSSLLYSVGPNGVDEQLTGDDLPAIQQEWHCLIAGAPTFLVLAALLLAWTRVPTWRRPRGPLGQEVLRSLALASAPALSLAWVLRWLQLQPADRSVELAVFLQTLRLGALRDTGPGVAEGIHALGAGFLLVLAWRLLRRGAAD